MFMILNFFAGICAVVFAFCSAAWHVPARRTGYTGTLIDHENCQIQLARLTFLADEHYGGGSFPVHGVSELLACVHYDTTDQGSGHVLTVLRTGGNVGTVIEREGETLTMKPGEDHLLFNGDAVIFSQGAYKRTYIYHRTDLTAEEWREAKWRF